jgi:uncharacterized repeat protein (TIGR03803 family)
MAAQHKIFSATPGRENYFHILVAGATGAAFFALTFSPALASSFQVLYSFCAEEHCTDGGLPGTNPLLIDSDGTLYGTTELGGDADEGTLFAMVPNAKKTAYKYPRL